MSVKAVIFDWGGTLTGWHDIDFHQESLALAQAVRQVGGAAAEELVATHAARLHAANEAIWGRSRDHQQSATITSLSQVPEVVRRLG